MTFLGPDENDVAYMCNECGEGFAPHPSANGGTDWPELRKMHKEDCPDATFTKSTVGKVF